MLNDNVKKVLKEQMWYVATYDNEPNAVPIGLKMVTDDGKLALGDVFMETTLNNVKKNGKVAVSACNLSTQEGYQVKGTGAYVTEGPVVDALKKMADAMFKGKLTVKGALVITPERVIVTTPGRDNKKEL